MTSLTRCENCGGALVDITTISDAWRVYLCGNCGETYYEWEQEL